MFLIRQVIGTSMSPTLRAADLVVFKRTRKFRAGQIVIAQSAGREIVKRLAWQNSRRAYLQGDHPDSSDCLVVIRALKGRLVLKF